MEKTMRRIRLFIEILFVACFVLAVGLAATRLCLEGVFPQAPAATQVEAGTPAPARARKTAANTVLNLPLTIPANALRENLEKYVPETYLDVDEDPTDLMIGDHIIYDLKRGPIDIQVVENGFEFAFPVTGRVKSHGRINLVVTTVDASAHATVGGRIAGRIGLKMLPDWQVQPELSFSVKIDEALVPIENFGKLSLRTFLEDKLTKKIEKERHKLVYKILARDEVRKAVTEAWEKMHRVEKIHVFPPVWVRVVPQKVGLMAPVAAGTDTLNLGLHVVLKTDMGISTVLPDAPVTPLPEADMLESISNRFSIRVPFQIEAAAVNEYLARKVAGTSRTIAKDITVSFERAQVLSFAPDKLTAVLFATARHDRLGLETGARIYLTGRMEYDAAAGIIRLADARYDAAFSPWWAAVAHWTVLPYIRHQARTRLVFSLDREIQKADRAIDQLITEMAVPPGIRADLAVRSPRLNRLGINMTGITGDLQLNGMLKASLVFPEPEQKQNP
ncbi:MAG: DUF4403 family protein [Thermodesulfobacteriota bacterium]